MAHSYRINYQHIVFHVGKMELKPADIKPVHEFFRKVLQELGIKDVLVGGVANHVHIIGNFSSIDPSVCVQRCKLRSSYWLKRQSQDYRNYFHWQTGYSSFSVSYSNVPHVKRYIRNQFSHHMKQSYEKELRLLTQKNGGYPAPDDMTC